MTKTCSKCKETQELSFFSKDKSRKDDLQPHCKGCAKIAHKKHYEANKEKLNIQHKQYNKDNQEKLTVWQKNWRQENKDKIAKYSKKWIQNNPKKRKNIVDKWRKGNLARDAVKTANRRAMKLQRTPSWLTEDDYKWIVWYYKQARLLTELTGIRHEVDHVIPMQGKNVSGLHTPYNLQILTKSENCSKNNKWEQE